MCKYGEHVMVNVKIPADLACEGREKWKKMGIDSCIAPIVKALQKGGINMRGSCCGHNKGAGMIHLQDGRGLLVLNEKNTEDYLCSKIKLAKKRRLRWIPLFRI